MQLDFRHLYLNNFRCYAGEHTFAFPNEPGLYFLTGKNLQEERLGSNGAGKSTLLDAIYWVLYGKTLRGLKGPEIVSWGQSSCKIRLDFTIGEDAYSITRTQSPNSLICNNISSSQDDIQKLIRLTPESFIYSVILPQFGQSFFELTPAVKLNLFSQVLDLDYWLGKSKEATTVTDFLQTETADLKTSVTVNETSINNLSAEIKELKKKEAGFTTEQKNALTVLKNSIEKSWDEEVELNDKCTLLEKDVDGTINEIDKLNKRLEQKEGKIQGFDGKIFDLEIEFDSIDRATDAKQVDFDNLGKIGVMCPKCKQKIDGAHLTREKTAILTKLMKLREELTSLEKNISTAKKDRIKLANEISDLALNKKLKEDRLADQRVKLAEAKSAFKNAGKYREQLQAQADKVRKNPNPYTELIDKKGEEIRNYKHELAELENLIIDFEGEIEATKFWVGGFKRVRLFIIENSLKTYEIEVNSNLAALGLPDWAIEVDVEKENKSGGVTKGFMVLIKAPNSPDLIKYESWSGGESQRLQLAGDLGLANLIMNNVGFTNSTEFYDEPSAHLSQEGLVDLAETLHQRAMTEHKKIFLIDHNTIEFGGFSDVFTVVKNKKGSSIKGAN